MIKFFLKYLPLLLPLLLLLLLRRLLLLPRLLLLLFLGLLRSSVSYHWWHCHFLFKLFSLSFLLTPSPLTYSLMSSASDRSASPSLWFFFIVVVVGVFSAAPFWFRWVVLSRHSCRVPAQVLHLLLLLLLFVPPLTVIIDVVISMHLIGFRRRRRRLCLSLLLTVLVLVGCSFPVIPFVCALRFYILFFFFFLFRH